MKLIPLSRRSKGPLPGKDWHEDITDDPAVIRRWIAEGLNVGFPLAENGCSAADFDRILAARRFWKEHNDLCQVVSRTSRGIHVLFSGTAKTGKLMWNNEEVGDKKGNGYLVWPPSRVWNREGAFLHEYRLIRGSEITDFSQLPPFPEDLFTAAAVEACSPHVVPEGIRDVRRYIRGIRAISGSGGHNATFRVACCLRDAGMDEASALAEMMEWNVTNAEPPWTAKELLHKVRDAYAKVMQ